MPSMMINMHHQNINKMDNKTENIPESTDIGKSLLCKHCKDGKDPYEKENGKRWLTPMYLFGERLFIKLAQDWPGRPKRDL